MTVLVVLAGGGRAPAPLMLVLQNTVPRDDRDGFDGFGGFGGCGVFSRDGYPPLTQPPFSVIVILVAKK